MLKASIKNSSRQNTYFCQNARMEKLRFRTVTGSLKVAGILLAVGGTMLLGFYKGKTLHLWGSILHYHSYEKEYAANHHVRGTVLLLGSSLTFACWYPIQVIMHFRDTGPSLKTVHNVSYLSSTTILFRCSQWSIKCIHISIGHPWRHVFLEDFRQH